MTDTKSVKWISQDTEICQNRLAIFCHTKLCKKILICLWSRVCLRYSRQQRNLPHYIVYLRLSHSFTHVNEMADWKTLLLKIPFLMTHSCAQAKKRNHTGETKSCSRAGGPIYSSTETNSRFQAGGPVYISKEEIFVTGWKSCVQII